MHDLVADYWWVSLFTVPALALELTAENAGWVDSLSAPVRKKLASFDHSFPGHWVVTASLRDGRRFSGLVIDARFRIGTRTPLPFDLRDVADVAWEGLADASACPVVQLSEGRPGPA